MILYDAAESGSMLELFKEAPGPHLEPPLELLGPHSLFIVMGVKSNFILQLSLSTSISCCCFNSFQ